MNFDYLFIDFDFIGLGCLYDRFFPPILYTPLFFLSLVFVSINMNYLQCLYIYNF